MAHEFGSEAAKSATGAAQCGASPLWVLGNRRAGRGRAFQVGHQLEEWFARRSWPVEFFWPSSREELRDITARAAGTGRRRLVVVGGDGTLLDVVSRIHGRGIELGLIPAGDANDVAAAVGLPREPLAAAELLLEWNVRPIDLVRVRTAQGQEEVYVGAGGAGLDAEAARLAAETFRWLPGIWRYVAGALVALGRGGSFTANLVFDGQSWQGSAFLVAVANAPAYGGGIRIAPEACLDDGWLDLTLIEDLSWWRVLRALPALVSRGEIRGLKLRRFRAREVRIDTVPSVSFHGDGEQLCSTPLEAEVLPGALRLVCPSQPR
jgi:diacylglycerol kinase (ATP)